MPSLQSSELEGLVVNGKACHYFQLEHRESHKIDRVKDEFFAKYKKLLPAKQSPISEENSMIGFSQFENKTSEVSFAWDDEQFIRHYSERLGQDFDFFCKVKKLSDDEWKLLKRDDRQIWAIHKVQ